MPQLAGGLGESYFLQSLNCARVTGKRTGGREEAEPVCGWWAVSLAGAAEGSRDPSILSRLGHPVFMFLWFCSLTQEKKD